MAGATKPVVGDWDGDGDDNVGVVKAGTYPNPDTWYLDTDGAGGAAERTLLSPTSLSNLWVAGDWDNDGDDNIGFFYNGQWNLDTDDVGGGLELQWMFGQSGDLPVSGRWQWLTSHTRDTYVYDGPHILLTFRDPDAGGPEPATLASRNTHGPAVDMLLAEEHFTTSGGTTTSATYWPVFDWLGSTRDLVDSTGAVQKHIDYDSFGNVIRVTNGSGQPVPPNGSDPIGTGATTRFLYTGREFDKETGLQCDEWQVEGRRETGDRGRLVGRSQRGRHSDLDRAGAHWPRYSRGPARSGREVLALEMVVEARRCDGCRRGGDSSGRRSAEVRG